jgi:hypothetical protein
MVLYVFNRQQNSPIWNYNHPSYGWIGLSAVRPYHTWKGWSKYSGASTNHVRIYSTVWWKEWKTTGPARGRQTNQFRRRTSSTGDIWDSSAGTPARLQSAPLDLYLNRRWRWLMRRWRRWGGSFGGRWTRVGMRGEDREQARLDWAGLDYLFVSVNLDKYWLLHEIKKT